MNQINTVFSFSNKYFKAENTITEMKNSLDGLISRIEMVEESSELEDKIIGRK